MPRNRIVVVVIVVAVFLIAGDILIAKSVGGGGSHVTLDVTVTGTTMSPSSLSVKQGDHVTMSVTTDKAEEIHLHEYDIKFEAEPGKKVTHTFTANITGDHVIEIEDTSTEIGKLTVNP